MKNGVMVDKSKIDELICVLLSEVSDMTAMIQTKLILIKQLQDSQYPELPLNGLAPPLSTPRPSSSLPTSKLISQIGEDRVRVILENHIGGVA